MTTFAYNPPNLRITGICQNCVFFRIDPGRNNRHDGLCRLEQETNPQASKRPVHNSMTCDAHIFRYVARNIHQLHDRYDAAMPRVELP